MDVMADWQHTASIVVVGVVTFVGDSARGILFPALWPLCQKLGGDKVVLGFLVATFSVGRLVITTRLGIIADKQGHRVALLLSGIVLVTGAAIWANSPFLGGLAVLFLAQFTLGLGTGSLGVTRSYVVEQTEPKSRTYILARLTALQYSGFSVTPILGSAFVTAGASVSSYWEYAFPAYLLLFISLCTLISIYYPFRDYEALDFSTPKADGSRPTSTKDSRAASKEGEHQAVVPAVSTNRSTLSAVLFHSDSARPSRDNSESSNQDRRSLDQFWLATHRLSVLPPKHQEEDQGDYEAAGELDDFWLTKREMAKEEKQRLITSITDVENHDIDTANPIHHSFQLNSLNIQLNDLPKPTVLSEERKDNSQSTEEQSVRSSAVTEETLFVNIRPPEAARPVSIAHGGSTIAIAEAEEVNKIQDPLSVIPEIDPVLKERMYMLMMFLNFSTRGVIAIMETQASQILLSQYNVSELRLGVYVSIAGSIGTVNLLCFKQFWCKHFTDYELMVGGMVVLGLAQSLAITWGPDENKPMWRFTSAMFIVYGFAYPVANSAVLGIFSALQKSGKQAKAQGRFAFMGSLARVLCPILSGYFEQYVESGSSFGFALILMSISIIGVMVIEPEHLLAVSAPKSIQERLNILTATKTVLVMGSLLAAGASIGAMADFGQSEW